MIIDTSLTRHKVPDEQFRLAWDFSNDLESGDTVSSGAGTTVLLPDGTDVTSTLMLGSPSVVAPSTVKITIRAGTSLLNYIARFKATTAQGDIFVRTIGVQVK